MADSTITEEAIESDKQGLVSVTFRTRNQDVTRDVYPEIAKFITSRQEAERQLLSDQRATARARQRYIWAEEDKFYADPTHAGQTFDDYSTGRAWDRDPSNPTVRRTEEKYYDFINASARKPENRNVTANPNSWEILRQEAEAAGHKTVVWVIDHCLRSEHEATILVKYLPASVEELWNIAKNDHDMCEVFDEYMAQAEQAGLFKDGDGVPASLREQRALRNQLTRTWGSTYARDTMPRLAPVLRAEREDAVAKARAEWDKELLDKYASSKDMQELLRSLADGHPAVATHLNRSDAQKAAWERRRAQEAQPGQDPASDDERLVIFE